MKLLQNETCHLVRQAQFAQALFRIALHLGLLSPQQLRESLGSLIQKLQNGPLICWPGGYLHKQANKQTTVFLALVLATDYIEKFSPKILIAFSRFEGWLAFLCFSFSAIHLCVLYFLKPTRKKQQQRNTNQELTPRPSQKVAPAHPSHQFCVYPSTQKILKHYICGS